MKNIINKKEDVKHVAYFVESFSQKNLIIYKHRGFTICAVCLVMLPLDNLP